MTGAPLQESGDTVSLAIKVDGTAIDETVFVAEIEIETAANRLPYARVVISDGSLAEATFAVSASGDFAPGKEIEIALGYNARTQKVFSGVIRSNALRLDPTGVTTLEIGCTDPAIELTLVRSSRLFTEETDADCLGEIIRNAGLKPKISMPGQKAEHRFQHAASDWDYLMSRAEAAGCIVLAGDKTVTIEPPSFDEPVVSVSLGDGIALLEAEIDAAQQIPAVSAQSWDPALQDRETRPARDPGIAQSGPLDGKTLATALKQPDMTLSTMAPQASETLEAWAGGQLIRSRLSRLKGRVRFSGSALPRVGSQIELLGLGAAFNGVAWIGSVRHRMAPGSWLTEVRFGLDRAGFAETAARVSAPAAAGLSPGIHGLQIATVLQVHEDPLDQNRIKVALPLVEGGDAGHWVRAAVPFAGQEAGIQFLPEVGDEVVLGFLQGDPDAAIMLGALHSPKRKQPIKANEKNTQKAIVTTSGLRIVFDEEKKSLMLGTPGGQTVTLDDDASGIAITDTSGNSVTLNEDGIKLESKGDLSLKASGTVSIDGKEFTGTATGDLTLKGKNLNAEAQMGLTAKGAASAELSASGAVTIKGLPVNLN